MISFFNRPFPYTNTLRNKFFTALGISVFVFIFLYVFKPFGMNQMNENQFPMAIGYGAVTFVVTMLSNVFMPRMLPSFFNEESWTVLKEIIYIQIVIAFVATGNLLYTTWLGYETLGIKELLNFEIITLAVAVIPVTLLILLKQIFLLRRNLHAAQRLSENLYQKERMLSKEGECVTINAENPKDNLVIEVNSIFYIAAADNYVEIFYSSGNGMTNKVLRTTMRSVQSNLKKFSQFYRCHRAFIVNLEKVKKVSGNAQGYRLILEDSTEQIPVSRSMNQEITLRLSR